MAELVKLSDNWSTLSDTEKLAVFNQVSYENATGDELETLEKFKVISFSEENTKPIVTLSAIPKPQTVYQKQLLDISTYENIDSITVECTTSGSGIVKIAVTADLVDYYTYDSTENDWVKIEDVANGMTPTVLSALTSEIWENFRDKIDRDKLGFAYYLSITNLTDVASVDKLSMHVDMQGLWKPAKTDTDYDYSYISNTQLSVNLLTAGDYKINYAKANGTIRGE